MPLPSGLQDQVVIRWGVAALLAASLVVVPGASDEVHVRVSIDGRVSRLALEDYVARVVAGEGEPRAPVSAQQALAITARTYALANLNRHRREGYDLCDTTHCQVLRAATEVTRRAAQATAGRVLLHQGRPASVYYSALCGGHSELASQVWPGADDSSSHLHEDEACRGEPGWSSELRAQQIEAALRAAGHRGTRLRELRVLDRNESGRVTRVRVDGFTPNTISGYDLRMAIIRRVGVQHFKSTAFTVRRTGTTYRFSGSGFGHGVGLCVIGAGRRAAQGGSTDAILKFYFPNLALASYTATMRTAAARPSSASPIPGPAKPAASAPVRDDIVMVLPAADSGERAAIVQLVRSARDQMTRNTGLTAPAVIRVTVHPTVDAFVRATGQPWWVSSASEGASIDLAPITLVRQRGQLERTIRHEVARVFVEGVLEGRREWVREGAASYLADPAAAGDPSARGDCPRDEELLRPLSAGVHRGALARAEACFRREIARGKTWDRVQ